MNIALIGRSQILYKTAIKLEEEGHDICIIITSIASPEYTCNENDFIILAKKLNAKIVIANSLDIPEFESYCNNLDIAISINWVTIIEQRHIDKFRYGILNSHHGDLPRYRGNACSNWAILKGEKKIVNSIHFMESGKLDCGRIIHREILNLNENTSIEEVYTWAEETTPLIFCSVLRLINAAPDFFIKYADPNSFDSFRCYPRLNVDGYICWHHSVLKIHNQIKSVSHPFPGAYTYYYYRGKLNKLIIWKSRVVEHYSKDLAEPGHVLKNDKASGESWIRCGGGTLAILECQHESETEIFAPGRKWNSIRMRLGARAEDILWEIYKKNSLKE